MDLAGKTALVTGASRGIGKACALYLAGLGADIAINYASSNKHADELVKIINDMGRRAISIRADVSIPEEADHMVTETIKTLGSLDILINNAGITKDTLLIRMKEEDWDRVLSVNLKGVFLVTRAAVRHMMKKRYGRIVNISSVIGISGNAGQANYAASKAGIIGFSKSIAKEFASRGILINVIAPGFIDTDMTDSLNEEFKKAILAQIPLGRYGEPEDIARLAGFLVSDDNRYITGQVIHVDGGMFM